MLQRWFVALSMVVIGAGAAGAQDRATIQMRDGTKLEGRIDGTADGQLILRVTQDDQRRLPLGSVALIDRVGGASGLPDTEIREAVGSQHLLLMSNGSSVKGQLLAIRGGQGSANEDQPRVYVFRNADGSERSYGRDEVSRVYLGTYPFAANAGGATAAPSNTSTLTPAVDVPGGYRIAANAGWVSTGVRVRRGEFISFNTSGEVQLSDNASDRATSAGTNRTAAGSPLPTVNAGALIGRVGNSQPFGIGNQASVPMPFDGVLYLAVNDDERSDNAGAFVVSIGRQRQ